MSWVERVADVVVPSRIVRINLKGKDHFGGLCISERIILMLMLEKSGMDCTELFQDRAQRLFL
jgi:hypothetical protein